MIPLFKVHMPSSVDESLLEVLHSGYIGQAVKVDKFEEELAEWFDNKYVLTLNAGTSALHLALRLVGVGCEDEVISTPMTCSATNTPIVNSGAFIVWADIDPKTGNIDPNTIEDLITTRTKVILCVAWGGYPCDLDEIHSIADEYGLKVIEDAAHAFGATYKGRKIGSISQYTEFSFQAIKHLTTVDGGALTCRDEKDYKRGKLLRWYGIDREGPRTDMRCELDIEEAGFKYHMNDVNAAIGLEQLKYVKEILYKHWENAHYYDLEFKNRNIKRCKPLEYKTDRLSSYWLYSLLVDDREGFRKFMANKGIAVSAVHSRNDTHSCFAKFNTHELPGVDEFCKHQVSVPVGWWVTPEDRRRIINTIEEWDHA